jgi:hypothetical protein
VSTCIKDPSEQTAASLLSGILADLRHLVEQQFQLTRRQIEDEIRQRMKAVAVFALGMVFFLLAAIAACLCLVHLLHWSASPTGTDPARLPLWACHAIVAAVLALIGGILVHFGRARFRMAEAYRNPATQLLQAPTS